MQKSNWFQPVLTQRRWLIRFNFILLLSFLCSSCERHDDKTIQLVQSSKIQMASDLFLSGQLFLAQNDLTLNSTWSDFANLMAKRNNTKRFKWKSTQTNEKGVFIVEFADEATWGWRWEVNLNEQVVQFINDSDYLTYKHNLSRFEGTQDFEVIEINVDTFKVVNNYSIFSGKYTKSIVYQLRGELLNKTDKRISSGHLTGKLKLLFKDKVISAPGNFRSNFVRKLSDTETWDPNTTREFSFETDGMDKIYLDYSPEYVIIEVGLAVQDPVGYSFDKNIIEEDIRARWIDFQNRNSQTEPTPVTKPKDKARQRQPKNSSASSSSAGEIETLEKMNGAHKEAVIEPKATYSELKSGKQAIKVSLDIPGWTWDDTINPKLPNGEYGAAAFEIDISADGDILTINTLESNLSETAISTIRKAIQHITFSKTSSSVPSVTKGKIKVIVE